jgi:hypothetical protein
VRDSSQYLGGEALALNCAPGPGSNGCCLAMAEQPRRSAHMNLAGSLRYFASAQTFVFWTQGCDPPHIVERDGGSHASFKACSKCWRKVRRVCDASAGAALAIDECGQNPESLETLGAAYATGAQGVCSCNCVQ